MDHSKPKSRTQIFFEKKENDRKKKKNKPKVYADRSPEGYRAFLHQAGNRNVAQFFEAALVRAKLAREQYEQSREEREADQVSEEVLREQNNQKVADIIRSTYAAAGFPVPDSIIPGLDRGKPIPKQERTFFEERMGGDFSCVCVHTGPTADQFARAINARAFTYGRNIAFANGEYSPGTRKGRRLMAHELTHVMQGGKGIRRKAKENSFTPTVPASINTGETDASISTEWSYLQAQGGLHNKLFFLRKLCAKSKRNRFRNMYDPHIEKVWHSFTMSELIKVVNTDFRLWEWSLFKNPELEDMPAVVRLKEQFSKDVKSVAKGYLDKNDTVLHNEKQRIGGSSTEVLSVSQKSYLSDIETNIQRIYDAQRAIQALTKIQVGVKSFIQNDINYPILFDPNNRNSAGLFTKQHQPNVITWDDCRQQYDMLRNEIARIADRFPVIFSVLQRDNKQISKDLAGATGTDLQKQLRVALELSEEKLQLTREKLNDGSLDPFELLPIHSQLFAGEVQAGENGISWTHGLARWAAQRAVSSDESARFWKTLGLSTLAAAAFVFMELASFGSAAFFIAGGLGVGVSSGMALKDWKDYNRLRDSSQANLKQHLALTSAEQADNKFSEAVLSSAFAFLEVAGVLTRGFSLTTNASKIEIKSIKHITRQEGGELFNLVQGVRKSLPSKLKKSGNVGVAKVDIEGLPSSFKAFSRINFTSDRYAELGFALKRDKRIFATKHIVFDRAMDTEAKILEDIAARIGNDFNKKGTIELFTERFPCNSCMEVFEQFLERYPNIELKVYWGKKETIGGLH